MVMAVGVARRYLLDAGGDAPHRLYARLRGCPAPRPPALVPPSPPRLPCPALSVPGGPRPPCPGPGVSSRPPCLCLPVHDVGSPAVTCALARTASARILPVPVPMPLAAPTFANRAPLHAMHPFAARLGALLAPLCVLPVPLPFLCSVSRVVPSAAGALSPAAPAGLGALPTPSPSLLVAAPTALCIHLFKFKRFSIVS